MYPNYFDGYTQNANFSGADHFDFYEDEGYDTNYHQYSNSFSEQGFDPDRQPQVRELQRRVNQLERQINQLNRRVNQLEQTVSRHTNRLNRLNQRLQVVERRLSIPFFPQFEGF